MRPILAARLPGEKFNLHSTPLLCTVLSDTSEVSEMARVRVRAKKVKGQSRPRVRSGLGAGLIVADRDARVGARDAMDIATAPLAVSSDNPYLPVLAEIEDLRRSYADRPETRYKTTSGAVATVVTRPAVRHYSDVRRVPRLYSVMRDYFADADRAIVCVRRQSRRQVLFAMRRLGVGGRRLRRPRWSRTSYIACAR